MKSPRRYTCLALFAPSLFAMSLLLTACGFEPLYSSNAGGPAVQAQLSAVAVDIKDGHMEQLVYSAMLDELAPLGGTASPAYRLEVTLEAIRKGVGFEPDDSVTRFNFQLLGTWRLIDASSQEVLFQSSSRSVAAYNVVTSQYATLTAEQDAEKRAAVDLARDVRMQLSLHFRQFHSAADQ